jgi:hypothetical protein
MPPFDTTAFMKLWSQSDQTSERKMQKFLLEGLDRIVQAQPDILGMLSKGPSAANPVIRWMEEIGYPTRVTCNLATTTMTITGKLFGNDVTAESIKQVIRVDTILERPADGLQVKVSSISGITGGGPFTCTVAAYGGTVLSDDTVDTDWDIIAEVWTDSKDADSTRSLDRTFREVGTQIHAETFEILKTRKNTKYEIVPDETQHQIMGLLDKLRRQLGMAILRSRPQMSVGVPQWGNKVQDSTMCGLCTWPSLLYAEVPNDAVYRDLAGEDVLKEHMDDIVRHMWIDEHADFGQGDWRILLHPNLMKYIMDIDLSYRRTTGAEKTIGFSVQSWDSKIGKTFDFVPDIYMRPGVLQVQDISQCKYGYYNQDELDRKELQTQNRSQRWLISFQTYGVIMRNARKAQGQLFNCKAA